jgi:hypothetical protein
VGALWPPGKGTDTVTQQKALKRRVRARMTKTGERYTAARRQVIAHEPAETPSGTAAAMPDPPGPPAEPAAERVVTPVPDSPFRGAQGASDEALVKRTGQPWEHWYRLLDAWGAGERPHSVIARWLNQEHGVDGWWAQELTVRYEMAVGRRKPGQRPDGFEATASKTLDVPVERLFRAFVDDAERGAWLRHGTRLRTAKEHRTARFDWDGGEQRVVAGFIDKGARSSVAVAHQRLPDAATAGEMKAFWREALQRLARSLASDR